MKAVSWGAGNNLEFVLKYISENVKVHYIVDSDKKKQGSKIFDIYEIIAPQKLLRIEFDLIIVSVKDYQSIEDNIRAMRLSEKTIYFWKDYANEKNHVEVFENRIAIMSGELQIYRARLDSMPFELGIKETPKIKSAEALLQKMIRDNSSLCRYGDGEFDIMLNRSKIWFQTKSDLLAKRLREILNTNISNINIAIAQNYIGFERYKEKAADEIRVHMEGNIRQEILRMLSEHKVYYDAYVSRPYCIYQDSNNADVIFPLFKELWRNRQVCVIEGQFGRLGIGNDLLDTACSIKRIACPAQNAWNRHEQIKQYVMDNISQNELLLISLGAAATVLAYDFAVEGYQAIDIGQIDNEYDWYINKEVDRVAIEGKLVAEISQLWKSKPSIEEIYRQQLVATIN